MAVQKNDLGLSSKHISKYEINADMGEGYGRWQLGNDAEMMKYIDAANIACGFHAGDPQIMRTTAKLCKQYGVKAGAHPGYQDPLGFGRRRINYKPEEIHNMVLYQVGALKAILDSEGVPLNHVKPHGELFYHMMDDPAILRAVMEACAVFKVPIWGPKNTKEKAVCDELGLDFVQEVYVDIDYSTEGNLLSVPQSNPVTPEICAGRFSHMAKTDHAKNIKDVDFRLGYDGAPFTVCVHADMPTALDNVKALRKAMDESNQAIKPKANGNGH